MRAGRGSIGACTLPYGGAVDIDEYDLWPSIGTGLRLAGEFPLPDRTARGTVVLLVCV